jgi:Metallo-peptidase family M12
MLQPTRFGRSLLAAISSALLLGVAQAQDAVSRPYAAPPALCNAFHVHAATVQHVTPLRVSNGDVLVEVEFGGQTRRLALQPHDVRKADFKLLVRDDNGIRELPRPANVTYRGVVLEDQGSWVAATVVGDAVQAIVHMQNGDEWAVQPVREAQPQAPAALHIVYRSADNQPLPWVCGTQGSLAGPVPDPALPDVTRITDIAIEADVQYYQLNASNTTNTQNDITGVVNAMDAIYLADVQVSFNVTQILVNTSTATNPYTTSVASSLLGEFSSYWNANRQGVQRDVAHLFTGRNMGQASGGAIGIAYLGVVCNLGAAYGVSQSRWTANFTRRVAVTAHELGHNFNAQHCDSVPPCYIMCAGVGGCQNVQTTFSQNERNQIGGFAASLGCLSIVTSVPQITAVAPSSVKSFTPGVVTLTGQGFLGTTQVLLNGTPLTSVFTTPDDNTLRFNPPAGSVIGPMTVQTVNPSGSSNVATLQVVDTNPASMQVNGAVIGGNSLNWSFGGTRNSLWVLAISSVGTTTPVLGLSVVDNPTVLSYGLLSPFNGVGSYSAFVPANQLSGLRIYSQIVELDLGVNITGISSSNIASTIIVN